MVITKNLMKAGELLGIEVLDHVVIGEGYWSAAENMGSVAEE